MRFELDREIAWSAAWDAATASMRAAGRDKWNEDDVAVLCRTFDRLWPVERDLAAQETRGTFQAPE